MSVLNGEAYLRQAIESILGQTLTDFEFIILDDGSTDSSWNVLTEFARQDQRIIPIQNPRNLGLTKSLNKGLKLARGLYIARQDADDVSFPERLVTQVGHLERSENLGLMGTAYYVIGPQGRYHTEYRQPGTDTEIRWQMLFHNAFCHSSVMFRRDLQDKKLLFYDESIPYSQDFELWSRMLRHTSGANLNKPLVAWRKNDNSISTARRTEQQQAAIRISAKQINGLLNQSRSDSISEAEVETLRDWFYAFPKQLKKKDVQSCRHLVRILNAFRKQPEIDQAILSRIIARKMMGRMCFALNLSSNWDSHTAALMADMLRLNVSAFFSQMINRAIHCMKRKEKAV